MEKKKIELYKVRSFSDKVNDTFTFLSENFKVLLKYLTYFLLPLSLLQAVALNGYMGGAMSMSANPGADLDFNDMGSLFTSLGGYMLLYMVGALLMVSVVYALMRLYQRRENRLCDLTWEELKPELSFVARRSLKLTLFGILVGAVLMALMVLPLVSGYLLLAFFVWMVMFVVAIPMMLFYPVYLFEDKSTLLGAFRKSYHLGFPTWGGILGIMLLLGFIASMVQGMVSIPWYIAIFFKMFLGAQGTEDSFVNSVGYSFLVYLFSVIQTYGAFLAYSITFIGLAIQYGHASEKVDGVTVEKDIEHFEDL